MCPHLELGGSQASIIFSTISSLTWLLSCHANQSYMWQRIKGQSSHFWNQFSHLVSYLWINKIFSTPFCWTLFIRNPQSRVFYFDISSRKMAIVKHTSTRLLDIKIWPTLVLWNTPARPPYITLRYDPPHTSLVSIKTNAATRPVMMNNRSFYSNPRSTGLIRQIWNSTPNYPRKTWVILIKDRSRGSWWSCAPPL